MDYRKQVELEAENTIGYSEAENKKSFMTGVSVGITLLEIKYRTRLKEIEQELKYVKINAETHKNDLTSLASIIQKYSENND